MNKRLRERGIRILIVFGVVAALESPFKDAAGGGAVPRGGEEEGTLCEALREDGAKAGRLAGSYKACSAAGSRTSRTTSGFTSPSSSGNDPEH